MHGILDLFSLGLRAYKPQIPSKQRSVYFGTNTSNSNENQRVNDTFSLQTQSSSVREDFLSRRELSQEKKDLLNQALQLYDGKYGSKPTTSESWNQEKRDTISEFMKEFVKNYNKTHTQKKLNAFLKEIKWGQENITRLVRMYKAFRLGKTPPSES